MEPPQGLGALLEESLVVYKGITDADGNIGGTTLKCSAIGSASTYPDFDGNQIILTSGSYKGQARDINGATNGDAAGTITAANAFDGRILSGTSFIITGIRTVPAEVAALEAKVDVIDGYHDVPGEDAAADAQMRDVVGKKTDTVAGTSVVSIAKQVKADIGTVDGVVDAIKLKSDLMNSDLGSGTLNTATANPHTATIVPSSLPTKMHLIFDISNLNTNTDDFEVQVSVGAAASERVIAWYGLTSDGTDITCDEGSGVGSVIKQRRIDISNILVYTGEQVIVSLKRNAGADDTVDYKYLCGV